MSKSILRLGLARLVMKLADSLLGFAIPLLVYQSTGSIAWSGLAFFIEKLPRILFLPLGGWLSDHCGGLRLMVISDAIRAALLLGTFALIWRVPAAIPWALPIVGAIMAVMNAQTFVALEAFLSQSATPDKARQMTYLQIADQASVVAGPVVAAATQAFTNAAYLLPAAAVLYLFSVVFVVGVEDEPRAVTAGPRRPWVDLVTGASLIARDRRLITLAVWAFSLNLILGLSVASSAALVAGRLGLEPEAYGRLQISCAVISLLVMLVLPRLDFTKHIDRAGRLAYATILIGCFVIAAADNLWVLVLGYALLSSPVGVFNVYIRTKRAAWIDSSLRGTITGQLLLLGQCGLPVAGLVLAALGAGSSRTPFFVAGGVALFAFALTQWLSRDALKKA